MTAGRPPIPKALNDLRGDPGRRRRYTNEAEPPALPPDELPAAPSHLDTTAKECWEATCADLLSMGLLSKVDLKAIETYSVAYSTWRESLDHIAKEGRVVYCDERERMVSNEWCKHQREAEVTMSKYLMEFGFSPAARARMRVPIEKKKSDGKWSSLRLAE